MLRTVLTVLALGLAVVPAPAAEDAVPEVAYRTTGVRGLVFVNNPEMIFAEELAEAGRSLHRDTLAAGGWRTWSQHWNRSGGPLVLAVALTNPGSERIRVRCTSAAPGAWADEFPAAWNAPRSWDRDLEPGATAWLFRSATIAPGAACGGVADVASDGPVVITHIATRGDPAAIADPTALAPVGYVTRTWGDRHREARVYKGSASAAAVRVDLAWSIGDDDRGVLPVRRRPFLAATGTWGDAVLSTSGWRTHISIGHQPDATMSDMLAFKDPAWPVAFDPAKPSDALGMIPNVGNWGVLYHHRFTITNRGTRPRTAVARIAGKGLHLAHQAHPDAPWVKASVQSGRLDWATATIPPGATGTIDGRWILGGPANGDIIQSVVLTD
jgi:hypothetical protein